MSSSTTERKKARQEEVYATAVKLFATKGYHGTRVQDIADELGMLKGSLYYYCSSKEDLLIKVTRGYVEEIFQAVEAIANTGYAPTQKLTLAIDEHLRHYQENAYIYAIFTQENLKTINQETAVTVKKRNLEYQTLWEQLLQEGISSGDFRPDLDIKITVKAILGMTNHTIFWYDKDGRLSLREIARLFSELLLKGMENGDQ